MRPRGREGETARLRGREGERERQSDEREMMKKIKTKKNKKL